MESYPSKQEARDAYETQELKLENLEAGDRVTLRTVGGLWELLIEKPSEDSQVVFATIRIGKKSQLSHEEVEYWDDRPGTVEVIGSCSGLRVEGLLEISVQDQNPNVLATEQRAWFMFDAAGSKKPLVTPIIKAIEYEPFGEQQKILQP